ncbi:SulP family inorganic anion transporter [Nonomuraea sp. H19]|uniref:SulP family inorganic anion transporter n=1 Tax=Nonomuraea sp. H19 TaxID=3452206 RepID=UPI003F8862C4
MANSSHPSSTSSAIERHRQWIVADVRASVVVFLVALPLCVGVAVASGVPAELGIVTGIVGGLVAGALPGSSLQVSGPAAGLTVLVAEAVARHGLAALGLIAAGAGLVQILLGVFRLGTWFQAISPSVVRGMLTGIGLVLVLGQLYPLAAGTAPADTIARLLSLPGLLAGVDDAASLWTLGVGLLCLAVLVTWGRMPMRLRAVPAPLVAVAAAAALVWVFDLPVARVEVGSLLSALNPPGAGELAMVTDPAVLGTMLTIAIVASAESLFSAAAVDRLHDGPPTRYNAELVAQGAGNVVSGALGGLPMTAVIVRSAANVQAGARTKASRLLHGMWLLLFVVALPGLLAAIPLTALAALLLHSGWKLINPVKLVQTLRQDRADGAIALITAITIAGIDLLTGVLIGLGLAVLLAAWRLSHVTVSWEHDDRGHVHVRLRGNATFLRLPQMHRSLQSVPDAAGVRLDLSELHHLDEATRDTLDAWAAQRGRMGEQVPAGAR